MGFAKGLCCAAALTVALAPAARADEWNKKTILTFSGPVQIPGATLPAGSYVFKLADIPGNRHVVQVFDKDEKKIYTTLLAVPNQRLDPSDKPVVLFSERATGSPQAVKVWYYPGETIGNEFVYPKSQAVRIAKASHTRVLATNDEPKSTTNTAGEIPAEMKTAAVGYFDENGNWQSDADKPVVTSNAPAQSARADTTPAPASTPAASATTSGSSSSRTSASRTSAMNNANNTQTAGTSGSRPARKHLPRTSSSLALFELISGLSLGGGIALRQLRARL
jgi:hypothetical protein